MSQDPDYSAPTPSGALCSPGELKRFKIARAIVFALSGFVFTMILTFGDYDRSFVDRMNMFLLPIVAVAIAVCAYALWRFRRACLAWREECHA